MNFVLIQKLNEMLQSKVRSQEIAILELNEAKAQCLTLDKVIFNIVFCYSSL